MRVVLGMGFDGGAWPGPLVSSGRSAAFDEVWVGALGFLKLLETALGLSGPDESAAERAAALVPALHATPGRWTRSLDSDALAVSRAVLRVRDALVDAGLRPGEPASVGPRLQEILEVTAAARAGVPDRFAAAARALEEGAIADIDEVIVRDPREALSPLLRRVLVALAARGVRVLDEPVEIAPATGDLGASRRDTFDPVGDGSLQLVRGDCPEETAIELAAYLSLLPSFDDVVIIGADAVLDAGLVRMGLPATGARGARGDDGLLQLAPLVVALAWPERDPERAFELLSLGVSPIRRSVGARLARSLVKMPAVGSAAWSKDLTDALAHLPGDDERRQVEDRLQRFVGGPGQEPVDKLPLADLDKRLDALRRWLFGRAEHEGDQRRYAGAQAQVHAIGRIARALGTETISRSDLMRVVEQATASARARTPREPLAGLFRVGDPAAVAGPVGHVVWWRFTDESEPPARALSVSRDEAEALRALGVDLPSAAMLAEQRALAWQRPLQCARTCMVLGSPRRNTHGDEVHPHPLWDEIVARAGGAARAGRLVGKQIGGHKDVSRKDYRARAAPRPQREWRFPAGTVPRPDEESPSARETLLGCSFKAVVERSGVRAREHLLPDGSKLFGEVAHDVIASVLARFPLSPDDALTRAREDYDALVPLRAAAWLRPARKSHRSTSRETIARAAAALVELLLEKKLTVKAIETEIKKGPEGRVVKGRPDLVVAGASGDHVAVIDLKSGGDRDKIRALEGGTAIQLVAYAQLVKDPGAPWPGIAYFQVRTRRLFSTSEDLAGPQAIESPYSVEDVVVRLKRAGREADDEIAAGRAQAPGVGARLLQLQSRIEGEQIVIAPPCRYCALSFLCGRGIDERSGAGGRDR